MSGIKIRKETHCGVEITITEEYWALASEVTYTYVNSQDHTLWNVHRVTGETVNLWSINGIDRTVYNHENIYAFQHKYRPYNQPSLKDQMTAIRTEKS